MDLKSSLLQLTREVPKEKIYVLQISDAYKPPTPYEDEVVDGLRPKGRWSHDCRPYLWTGGYLSVKCVEVAKAVLGTGSRCWFSIEVFDGQAGDVQMAEFCNGAMKSYKMLLDECATEA